MPENKQRTDTATTDTATEEEARHLAEEGLEELRRGNKEEAKVVIDEARKLDRDAAESVLEQRGKSERKS